MATFDIFSISWQSSRENILVKSVRWWWCGGDDVVVMMLWWWCCGDDDNGGDGDDDDDVVVMMMMVINIDVIPNWSFYIGTSSSTDPFHQKPRMFNN